MRVDRASNHFAVGFIEFFSLVRKFNNFSGTHKSEVKRIEEQNNVFSSIIFKTNFFEISFEN